MEQELQQLLQKNWFQNGLEAMRAKLFLKRAIPDKKFNIQINYSGTEKEIITAEQVKETIEDYKKKELKRRFNLL